ncbi:MAG: hypothetical protein M3450_05710 [Actinomycetota bacterium]|nr:hypothetical protein [Actinomycetota bacterium]
MDLPVAAAPIALALSRAASDVLGPRLLSFVAYGSAVTGDILPGYSDFDVAMAVRGLITLHDALSLEAVTGELDIAPFNYCQPKFLDVTAADAVLVPKTFVVVVGHDPPPAWIFSAPQLRTSGEQWLAGLPAVLAHDAADWSFTTSASRPRQARLHLTRVKPSLRALLVHHGCDPVTTWSATWAQLGKRLAEVDAQAAGQLGDLLASSQARDDRAVAVAALRLTDRICLHHPEAITSASTGVSANPPERTTPNTSTGHPPSSQ